MHGLFHRTFSRSALVAGATLCLSTSACGKWTSGCLEIDGPCASTGPVAVTFILGLDPRLLDRSIPVNAAGYRAVLPVGTTVTLRAVRNARGEGIQATDTLRTVTWVLTDSSSATLRPGVDGSAQLIATKVGRVGVILANGSSLLYACENIPLRACASVGAIDVVTP
jgi:hypothetical protein